MLSPQAIRFITSSSLLLKMIESNSFAVNVKTEKGEYPTHEWLEVNKIETSNY